MYNDKEVVVAFAPDLQASTAVSDSALRCQYTFNVFPNDAFVEKYSTTLPIIFTTVVAGLFLVLIIAFVVFDQMSQKRHDKVLNQATKSNAIVSSLFPAVVYDQLYEEAAEPSRRKGSTHEPSHSQLKEFMLEEEAADATSTRNHDDDIIFPGKPLAELFPEATIMFADLAGFTAWSSVREPAQVFILLETLYRAFDKVAKRRRIFKVETIGDCYVAVCG